MEILEKLQKQNNIEYAKIKILFGNLIEIARTKKQQYKEHRICKKQKYAY